MSAHLASATSMVDGFTLNSLVGTDAMMACRSWPPISNQTLAMVAHELRGPLTPLRMASELIRKASAERPEILRLTDMIDRQVNGIARLAQDLMDATRVDRDALRLSKADIEVAALLADICEVTALAAAAKHQVFTVLLPDTTLHVEGDPDRLTQAIGNLLHNAVKYTPMHGNIRLTVFAEGIKLVIRISDDGPGISSVLLPHIFDLFAQSSRTIAASAGGLGIGLAVVKAIARSHGGTVSAISDGPGEGSEFTLELPIIKSGRAFYGSV